MVVRSVPMSYVGVLRHQSQLKQGLSSSAAQICTITLGYKVRFVTYVVWLDISMAFVAMQEQEALMSFLQVVKRQVRCLT